MAGTEKQCQTRLGDLLSHHNTISSPSPSPDPIPLPVPRPPSPSPSPRPVKTVICNNRRSSFFLLPPTQMLNLSATPPGTYPRRKPEPSSVAGWVKKSSLVRFKSHFPPRMEPGHGDAHPRKRLPGGTRRHLQHLIPPVPAAPPCHLRLSPDLRVSGGLAVRG